MAATSSPTPTLFSVLTTSNENEDDLVSQLRNHLTQIETNVQQTWNRIQQRKPFSALSKNPNQSDPQIRKQFFHILKDVATKNNLPFNEQLFGQQFLENNDSSPKVEILRDKPSVTANTNDQHLSPVNNARRSQFAPVLSSTPVHQISPLTPIPVDLTMATPSVAPVLTITSNDLPAVPPSAIVPQRAHIGRPPRIPRSESATQQKKNPSPITEQQEDIVIAQEIRVSSKRRIKTKQEIVEDQVEVIIEQKTENLPDIIKEVQSTPMRGRKKKVIQEDIQIIPQLEPPPPALPPAMPVLEPEIEVVPKKTRGGRSKKKDEQAEVKPTRTASARGRKKQEETEEVPAPLPKKPTRGKKLIEPIINIEENPPPPKVRATPSRGKKKSPVEIPEPMIPSTPKKSTTTRSKKRKDNEATNENPLESIQPPSPKRRGGRNTKSKNSSPVEIIETLPPPPPAPAPAPAPASARSSRRAKKEVEIPIEKQDEIVLNKKARPGRGKKNIPPSTSDAPLTMVDLVMSSVVITAPTSIDSIVAKPPRPPVARKKKSLAMPPLPQTSPSTPPPTQRIQSTSPVQEKVVLPLPIPRSASRRRRIAHSPQLNDEDTLEIVSSTNRNPKRTHSNVISTPKRVRRENLIVTAVPSTPGKKRKRCTCQKRRNKICDICAAAIDA